MFSADKVFSVHLEVTDKCNANCPMCARSHNGGRVNPRLRNIEMSLETAQKVFNPEFTKQIRFLQMCGNFGDPIVAKDTVEILEYLRSVNPDIKLGIHTNGSLRTADWWARLGKILSQEGDYCKFGIDGLADTNAIYRQNTSWPRIMTAAKSFIAAGGVAHWEYLVFKHNEHQIEEAREMAKTMGFHSFFVKKTSRFFNYQNGKNEPFPILNKAEKVVGHLEPPTQEDFINPVSLFGVQPKGDGQKPEKKPASVVMPNNQMHSVVDCMSLRDQSIYISAAGEIYPCCFIGGQVQYADRGIDGDYLEKLAGGFDNICATQKPIESIINGSWFGSIAKAWEPNTPPRQKIGTCHRLCGKNQHIVKAEYA